MAVTRALWLRSSVLCVLLAAGAAHAGKPLPPTTVPAVADLAARYRAASRAKVGVHAVRLADGAVLADVDSGVALVPASNQKILTSAVAIKRLGEGFRFRTVVGISGKDLVVLGDGDPTTGDQQIAKARGESMYAAFRRWAIALRKSKFTRIEGDLVIRTGVFKNTPYHPDWLPHERTRWFSAPVAGVNFNDNCLDVGFEVKSKQVTALISPVSRYLRITNMVRVGSPHQWSCRFDALGQAITLTGAVSRSTTEPMSVAVPNPAVLFGCVLAHELRRAGIRIDGRLVIAPDRSADPSFREVASETAPLATVLHRANKRSLNMMAECLFLRSAVEAGEGATWSSAAACAERVLARGYGVDPKQFVVADGSGLSRRNRVSPAALTQVLRALARKRIFVLSLPIAGVDGSLRSKLGAASRGRVVAKTGHVAGVNALSGYVLSRRGTPAVAFSIIVNGSTVGKNYSATALQTAICKALVDFIDGSAVPRPAANTAMK